jgi:hypothetical protein
MHIDVHSGNSYWDGRYYPLRGVVEWTRGSAFEELRAASELWGRELIQHAFASVLYEIMWLLLALYLLEFGDAA